MEIIVRKRGEGKTTELIKLSANTGKVIVCINELDVARIIGYATKMGCIIPKPVTYSEFIGNNLSGREIAGVLIDNADTLISGLTNHKVDVVTMTGECSGDKPTPNTIWAVTKELNSYNQFGDYLVSVFDHKPTFQELKQLLPGEPDSTIDRLAVGGGRHGNEGSWYYLTELNNGQLYQ